MYLSIEEVISPNGYLRRLRQRYLTSPSTAEVVSVGRLLTGVFDYDNAIILRP